MLNHGDAPTFAQDVKFVQWISIRPNLIQNPKIDAPLLGDLGSVLDKVELPALNSIRVIKADKAWIDTIVADTR